MGYEPSGSGWMMDKTEQRLVLLSQAGDPLAFDQLLRKYERQLFSHLFRILGNEDASYEALQDTYVAILRSIRKLRSRSSFKAWAYGVATRTALKTIRRRSKARSILGTSVLEPADLGPLPDSLASAREEKERMLESIVLLSPKLRSVILLHYYEGLTLKEVAASLEISLGTAKSRLAAGLAQLRHGTEEAPS